MRAPGSPPMRCCTPHRPPDHARPNLTRLAPAHRAMQGSAAIARIRDAVARPADVTRRSANGPPERFIAMADAPAPPLTAPPRDRLPRHAEPARHAVPDARRPAQARAGLGQGVERRGRLQAPARGAPRPAALRAARRPAVRERRDPHRPRGQQDPEGHDRQGAPARRLRRAATCRAGTATACRSRTQIEKTYGRNLPRDEMQAQEPRLRHRADRAADGRLQAPRRARRLGPSVPDDGLRQRGRRDPRARSA